MTVERIVDDTAVATSVAVTSHDPMLAWLAGLLEGEGYFCKDPLIIALNMTDEDVVRKACHVAGCGSIIGPLPTRKAHHKPIWRWKVSRAVDVWVLTTLMRPYMGARRCARFEEINQTYADMTVGKVMHGTRAQYKRGCRCQECRHGLYLAQSRLANERASRKVTAHQLALTI